MCITDLTIYLCVCITCVHYPCVFHICILYRLLNAHMICLCAKLACIIQVYYPYLCFTCLHYLRVHGDAYHHHTLCMCIFTCVYYLCIKCTTWMYYLRV